jgi:hypothetical protein
MIYTRYFFRTYFADGIHVSQTVPCETADEALAGAAAWRANGHKTEAIKVDIDLETLEVKKTLL